MGITNLLSWLFIVYIGLIIIVLIMERRKPTTTIAWVLLLIFLPYLGFVIYVLFGKDISRKNIFRNYANEINLIRDMTREQSRDIEEGRLKITDEIFKKYKGLILMNLLHSNSFYSYDNEVEIITDGEKKFGALFSAIKNARKYVHMQYFILENDNLGNKFMDALIEKAKEGVEVRLLVDDMGNFMKRSRFNELLEAGGRVHTFFPVILLPFLNILINNRNHRKLGIIDGQIGFIGGFNVGDEYLGLDKRLGYWRDTHLVVKGSAVHEIQSRFLMDWRVASGVREEKDGLFCFPQPDITGDTGIQIVSSGPDSRLEKIKYAYIALINTAQEYIYIQTPYFIPDDSFFDAIKIALLKGVDVRLMVPNKPDHMFVYWATYSYIGDLLEYGLKAYTYENGFLHSKTMVVDDEVAVSGTANFDIRSFKLNFEVNAFMYDKDIAVKFKDIFYEDMKKCNEITLEVYKKRNWKVRLKEPVARLVSPLL